MPYNLIITIILLCAVMIAPPAQANQLHPLSGAYFTSEVDLKVAARGIPMAWERTYRSNRTILKIENSDSKSYDYVSPEDGPLGYGWFSPFTMRIWKNAPQVSDPSLLCDALVDADGRIVYFPKDAAGIVQPDYPNGYTLSTTATGWTLTQRGGSTWTFDQNGRLLTITDTLGRSAQLTYSGDQLSTVKDSASRVIYTLTWDGNHITKVTDLANRSIDYQYDSSGNLITVSHNGDTINSYSYNAAHGLVTNSNAINETWRINYRYPPSKGIATSLTAPDQGSTVQSYDRSMSSVTIKDPAGNIRTQSRNTEGQLTAEQDSSGQNSQIIAYLGGGARTITDAQGNITKEYRDLWDNVTKRIDAEGGVTTYSYNSIGKPTQITDAENSTTEIAYESTGSLPTSITRAKGASEQTVTTFSYETTGDLKSTTTGNATTSFTYNDAGLPLTITDPEGGITTLEYDTIGNLTSSTDASGNKTAYSYDWRGNLLSAKDAEGNETKYSYNAAGRLTTVTDPKGSITTTTTDYAGRITNITAPSGSTAFTYDKNGNLITATRGDATTTYTFDSKNRLQSAKDPENNLTTYGYASGGVCTTCGSNITTFTTPTSIVDPLNNVTTNTLDRLGRIKEVSDPLNNLTKLVYDKVGRIKTRTDAENNQTGYQYDALGRIKSQSDAQGGVTSFSYDERGNLTSLIDPEGNTTSFEYDKAGRKTKETRPEGQATSYSYYNNGLLKTVTDAKGQTTTYTYDKANRLTETKFSDNTKHLFQYDKNGNLTGYTTPDVTATITYDAANRKTSETVTIGTISKTYSYSYDSKGNKQSFTSPEGITYSYTYNRNDQPLTITTPAGQITLDYSWIRNNKVTLPNGIITDYSYNANSWLTRIAAQKAPNTVLAAGYQFDKVGNITQKASDVTTDYGYDKIYQLINSTNPTTPEALTYDKVGNRKTKQGTQTPWTYNRNNELQATDTVTYGYDNNGNTTTKTDGSTTTIFNYSAQDRLQSVQLPDGRTATYIYDPFGRRIRKQVGTETTIFIYADEGLIGEYSETGVMKKGYGWRPNGIWGTNPLFQIDSGSYYFYHNDHLGTPQSMTDQNGDIVWEATYEAFGKATVDLESTVVNNLRFPGQYWDEETGLHWNWNRYYDPGTGRYVSKDPLGIWAFDYNLFRYGLGNPVRYYDNDGLLASDNPIHRSVEKFIDRFLESNKGAILQGGFQASVHYFAAGVSVSCGGMVGGNSKGSGGCVFCQACVRVGPGLYGGAGGVAGLSGTNRNLSDAAGGFSIGAGADFGVGPSIGGATSVGVDEKGINSIGGTGPVGKAGGGFGISMGIDICYTKAVCAEKALCKKR